MSVFVEAIDAMENVKNANCVVNFFLYPIDKTWAICIVQNVMANAYVSTRRWELKYPIYF